MTLSCTCSWRFISSCNKASLGSWPGGPSASKASLRDSAEAFFRSLLLRSRAFVLSNAEVGGVVLSSSFFVKTDPVPPLHVGTFLLCMLFKGISLNKSRNRWRIYHRRLVILCHTKRRGRDIDRIFKLILKGPCTGWHRARARLRSFNLSCALHEGMNVQYQY